jgi:chromosome segregation ATPase
LFQLWCAGLSNGQAGLLADFARFRGEIVALRNEIEDKRTQLANKEDESRSCQKRCEELQQRLKNTETRLQHREAELKMMGSTELLENLRQAQSERDMLIDYIQSENSAQTQLSSEVESLKAKLVAVKEENCTLREQLKAASNDKDDAAALRLQLVSLESELQGERRASERKVCVRASPPFLSSSFTTTLITSFRAAQDAEIEEMGRMQLEFLSQLKEKTDLADQQARDLQELSAKLRETEQTLMLTRADSERRGRTEETTQQQLNQALTHISQLEPKVASLQSEVKAD